MTKTKPMPLPRIFTITGTLTDTLLYGENSWQDPAGVYVMKSDDPLSLANFKPVAGSNPSFNNTRDYDRALQTITHIAAGHQMNFPKRAVPCIALVVKHGNVCSLGVATTPDKALRKMMKADGLASFGGIVMTNFAINGTLAKKHLVKQKFDGILASSITKEAVRITERVRGKCRFRVNPALKKLGIRSLDQGWRFTYCRGQVLVQPNYTHILDLRSEDVTIYGRLNLAQRRDLISAWGVCATSNSNTISILRDGQVLGNGVGQQARVYASKLALERARSSGHDTRGAVAVSDSFFVNNDAIRVLVKAGIRTIFTTSGSVLNDKKAIAYCKRVGVTLVMIPDSKGRMFFGH